MSEPAPTVHASAVLIGARAVLIRGPSAAGKSRLALCLLLAAQSGLLPFARLVGDDRLHLEVHHERLLVRPPAALAGLIEVRGLGHPARRPRAAGRGRAGGRPRRNRHRAAAGQRGLGGHFRRSVAAACGRSERRSAGPGLGVSGNYGVPGQG